MKSIWNARSTIHLLLSAVFVMTVLFNPAAAQDRDAIKETMKDRYEKLAALKAEKKIGETTRGFVEATSEEYAKDETIKAIVDGENADREKLYAIIAKDTETTPEVVGKNNALRIFKKAEPEELFKGKDNKWLQKKEIEK